MAEHPVHNNELAAARSIFFQAVIKARHVIVVVAQEGPHGEQAPVHDAGVILLVGDHVFSPSHHGADGAEVGLKPVE